ncbi:MAG: protein kinase, partial [Sandaracinaceae bacterium]|nr:protein kinase [Sandaracinaceae bacterium]
MAKTPREVAVRQTDAAEPLGGVGASASNTSSGEHNKLDAVRCPHCTEAHPPTYSHCPRTGKPLQTGPALVGRIIAGRYRVTGILGEGGMGAVYIAEHLLLGRKVAIKRLHPELTGDEKAVARFQREARAAAATGHEHIVEVLDLGYAEDGAPYLVMEYLRGVALAQVLKQEGRLPLARAANIIGQVLAALAAVHQREIVHRDLKPDNVFLTRRGGVQDYVKVLDFGISKMKQDEGEPTNLTRTGVTMGTPYYMSPEQARGMRKLDHRVDLYAVAVMMYECLTGRLPLMGDNYHALLQQILRVEPLPPSSIVPGLPAALDAVLLKGLAKDPAQRFSSAAEMLEALAPFGARAGDLAAMVATQPVSIAKLEEAARVDVRAPTEAAASSGALGSGALGSGALGSGALGSGALGSGALGAGALGDGALAGPPAPSAPIAASSPIAAGPA